MVGNREVATLTKTALRSPAMATLSTDFSSAPETRLLRPFDFAQGRLYGALLSWHNAGARATTTSKARGRRRPRLHGQTSRWQNQKRKAGSSFVGM